MQLVQNLLDSGSGLVDRKEGDGFAFYYMEFPKTAVLTFI